MSKVDNVALTGRALEKAEWKLPKRFRLTAKQLAKSDAEQKRLSALVAQPFGQPSVQDVYRARAVVMAEHLRDSIDHVSKQISAAILSGEKADLKSLQEAKTALQHRLAENYALFGRYDLALQVEPNPVYAEHYHQILQAVWRDDDKTCGCPDHRGSGEHANITTSTIYVKEEVWSIKHGRVAYLVKCSSPGCDFLNVVPDLPKHVREQRAHRARAHQLVQGMGIEDAERTLRAKNHTAAQLLK